MNKATSPEEWEDLLYMYQDDKSASEYVLDQALDLIEEVSKHTIDGRFYESMTMLVKTGEPLPELYKNIQVRTMLTETEKTFKVMGIKNVRWIKGGVVVEFYGQKIAK